MKPRFLVSTESQIKYVVSYNPKYKTMYLYRFNEKEGKFKFIKESDDIQYSEQSIKNWIEKGSGREITEESELVLISEFDSWRHQ